jgi:colanic acid biosynthesis glycosyl transferase WcaI
VKGKSLKILIYSANFAPEQTGIGKYSGDMAAWLAEHGHEVRVVSAPPYYPRWEVDSRYRGRLFQREQWRGVSVWRAAIWIPKSLGGLKRVLHLLSFAMTSFPLMLYQLLWRPNLVMVVAPAFICAPAALLTARLAGADAWLHMQDFEADIAFRMNILRGKMLQRVVMRMEGWVLKRFDVVSTISGRMIDRLLLKGVEAKRIRFFPNWVDSGLIKTTSSVNSYRSTLGIAPQTTVVLFSGSLGDKQGLMVVPAAARALADRKDVVFVICGDGVMKPQLEAACADLPNTRFMPLQPFERLGELLCMADVHLLPQSSQAQDLVLPSKLSGMLASGRPVIATCHPGTELDAVVTNCGLVVPPEDSEAVVRAVCTLAGDSALRARLGRAARLYAETHFERDAVLSRIFAPYEDDQDGVPNDVAA